MPKIAVIRRIMDIKFEKWQGLGNDFIILENADATSDLAKLLCDRNFGIGADGVFSAVKFERSPSVENADIAWKFYNSDGSIAQMCGNGMRCFAKYVYNKGIISKHKFSVQTLAGVVVPEVLETGKVRVDMGMPVFEASRIPVKTADIFNFEVEGFSAASVSIGNPHCVIFTDKDTKKLAREFGPSIEVSPLFPEKTNVEFVQIISRKKIKVDVFERGCGITLACGTGACASVVLGVKKGLLDETVDVILPGGELQIQYQEGSHVFMTGDAQRVFSGVWYK